MSVGPQNKISMSTISVAVITAVIILSVNGHQTILRLHRKARVKNNKSKRIKNH